MLLLGICPAFAFLGTFKLISDFRMQNRDHIAKLSRQITTLGRGGDQMVSVLAAEVYSFL